jgi:hypothetical protein
MKKLTFICLFACTLFSCTKVSEKTIEKIFQNEYPQKWQLITMSGQFANSERKGTDMEWQEFYLLNSDGTFIKSRERNGVSTEVSGTFSFDTVSGIKYLTLTYKTDNSIIGSCTSDLKESLCTEINTTNRMTSSWAACDGPGLEYERVE